MNWEVCIEKTDQNFEYFWQTLDQTSKKRKFGTHGKEYYKSLFKLPFSYIINIKLNNVVMSSWFGIQNNNSLVYLYGGNTDEGLTNKSQYFIHLVALKLLKQLELDYYDLGGYDPDTGYGKFKANYKGKITTFVGPIDIILESRKYSFTSKFVSTSKSILELLPGIR